MAEEILKELKYGDSKVLVEAAKRDGEGKVIADSYVDKKFIQFPSVEVFHTSHGNTIHTFSASLGSFFRGATGHTTTANYYYFDASKIKVILDRPITEEGYILVMFQMKRKRCVKSTNANKITGYRFTHRTNTIDSLVPAELQNIGFWLQSFRFVEPTIGQDVINTFKSEWAVPVGKTSFTLSGNICVCQTVKQPYRESIWGLKINADYKTNKTFYGYERLAFAICKYEPTISAKRMLIGPKTIIKTAIIFEKGYNDMIGGIKFTMR